VLKEDIEMYGKNYHAEVHKNLLEDEAYYRFRAKYSEKMYWKYLKGNVLEFGCGMGQNIFLNKDRSFGIDISEFALEECKKRGMEVGKDVKKVKDENFQGVMCIHVLEHLKNPYETVQEFYRVLAKGGRLLLVLPRSDHLEPVKNFKSDVAKHLYNWNFYAINELLSDVGFSIKLNKYNYASGFSKYYKLPYSLAGSLLKITGKLRNKKEMIIVAEK
jgi:SAM-dependent methyltransferase